MVHKRAARTTGGWFSGRFIGRRKGRSSNSDWAGKLRPVPLRLTAGLPELPVIIQKCADWMKTLGCALCDLAGSTYGYFDLALPLVCEKGKGRWRRPNRMERVLDSDSFKELESISILARAILS